MATTQSRRVMLPSVAAKKRESVRQNTTELADDTRRAAGCEQPKLFFLAPEKYAYFLLPARIRGATEACSSVARTKDSACPEETGLRCDCRWRVRCIGGILNTTYDTSMC